MLSKKLGLGRHRIRERVVVVRIDEGVRVHLLEVLQAQPLRGEAGRERLGLRIREHPFHFPLEAGRRLQRAVGRRLNERRVGHTRPEEI